MQYRPFLLFVVSVSLAAVAGGLAGPRLSVAAETPAVKALIPVSQVKSGFSLAEAKRLGGQVNVANLLKGEDVSLYWSLNVARFMPTAVIPRRAPFMELPRQLNPKVGEVVAASALGKLSLDAFMSHPQSRAQGFIVIHQGRVVYEQYTGMQPDDIHFWASNAKPMASLVIDLLINDGKIDEKKTFGEYVPDFRGTAWEKVRVIDILDMTPGLDTEENDETRADKGSVAIRTFLAEIGEPSYTTGKVETVRKVLKSAKKVREPGTTFDYGSPVTQALVFLAEEVSQQRWADLFDERVWSKVGADGDLQVHLAPDGTAGVHGLVSSRLRDMARFGLLYTPSWNKTATQQIVTPAMIDRIRKGVRTPDFFMKGYDGPVFVERLNAKILGNSRQWDAVFEDGDFFKSGFMGQGIYVSPDRDLVIAFFSTNSDNGASIQRYLRPLATSGLFGK